MADQGFEQDFLRDFLEEAAAVSPLANNEKTFRSVFAAFRKGDAKAFQAALKAARLLPRCHLICRWFRVKECILLCLELCGPPKEITRPNPRRLAEAIVKITSDEKAVAQLAAAVEKRDRAAFQRIAKQYELGPLCHFFCHWVCVVRYRLVCRWICEPDIRDRPSLAAELYTAGHALRLLLENGFDEAAAASQAGDAEKLRKVITDAGLFHFCHFYCEWFCSWRCVLVCLTICREFPLVKIENPVAEAFEFAQATQVLRKKPDELAKLGAAIDKGDAKAFGAIVTRLELGRYCIQLCHWLCFLRCRRFCIIVCPPPDTIPLFTHVGAYHVDPIYGDFTSDGTTTAGEYAFTRTIPLDGILPDGTALDAVEYRFQIAKFPGPGPVQNVVGAMVTPTKIGQLQYWYWNGSAWTLGSSDYWVNSPGATATIPQQFGPPLVVPVTTPVKAGGWIEVPRENNFVIGGGGRFVRSAAGMVALDTRQLTNEAFDLRVPAPGLKAGDSVPAAKKSEAPKYRIYCEARKVLGGSPVSSNQLDKIAFSNTAYTYTRHLEWAGGDVTTKTFCSLDIGEFLGPGATGCDKLSNTLHAFFSTYHPYLDSVTVSFEGQGVPPPAAFNPAIAGGQATSPAGGKVYNITALQPCAYILWLSATVNLTQGWGLIPDATDTDHIAFCKGR
jgi:hypothetical protein